MELAAAERPVADEATTIRQLREAAQSAWRTQEAGDLSDAWATPDAQLTSLAPVADAMLGNVLVSLAYARYDLGDPDEHDPHRGRSRAHGTTSGMTRLSSRDARG